MSKSTSRYIEYLPPFESIHAYVDLPGDRVPASRLWQMAGMFIVFGWLATLIFSGNREGADTSKFTYLWSVMSVLVLAAAIYNPENKAVKLTRGAVKAYADRDLEKAVLDTTTAIGISTYCTKALLVRAMAYIGQEEYADAAVDLEKYQYETGDYLVYLLIGYCQFQGDNYDQALEYLKRVPYFSPHYINSTYLAAQILFAMGEKDEAVRILQKAVARIVLPSQHYLKDPLLDMIEQQGA